MARLLLRINSKPMLNKEKTWTDASFFDTPTPNNDYRSTIFILNLSAKGYRLRTYQVTDSNF